MGRVRVRRSGANSLRRYSLPCDNRIVRLDRTRVYVGSYILIFLVPLIPAILIPLAAGLSVFGLLPFFRPSNAELFLFVDLILIAFLLLLVILPLFFVALPPPRSLFVRSPLLAALPSVPAAPFVAITYFLAVNGLYAHTTMNATNLLVLMLAGLLVVLVLLLLAVPLWLRKRPRLLFGFYILLNCLALGPYAVVYLASNA